MDDKKLKTWLVPRLRRVSYSYPPRNKAKAKQRVAPATFECQHCGIWIYEGSSVENMGEIASQNPDREVIQGGTKLDHLEPVVDPFDGYQDIGTYVKRMFCGEEGFQVICEICHLFKTAWEDYIRKNP